VAGILSGLRIVEISAFVSAPFAGVTLAGMGADVIRVEPRGGGIDAGRWPLHDGRSLYRAGLDRGKRSLAIDLRSAEGQELVSKLIRGGGSEGGILITNLGAEGWLAYERLAAGREDLIMVLITGTASGGTAVDYTVNAGLGFPFVTGPTTAVGPVNHVLPAWDVTTGALAALAVLAAERRRRLTGGGGLVELALSEVGLEVAECLGFLAEARLRDEPRPRLGNEMYGTYGRDFKTADGRYVMACALTPRQWQSLVAATGIGPGVEQLEAASGADLRDEGERFRHRVEISALVGPWVASRPLSEVAGAFDREGVLWGPYRTFQELVAADPSASSPSGSPLRFEGDAPGARPAPAIGADTEAVLRAELGLDDAGIARLRSSGVID
jgi:2-methylfumaryl-CoA isomerase